MQPLSPQNSKIGELEEARRSGASLVLVVLLFSFFVNLLMLTGPLFMLQVYDRVLGSRSEETLAALFLLVGGLYLLMAALDYARGRVMARYGAAFQSALDATVFEANLQQSVGEDQQRTGLRDLEVIQTLTGSPVFLALFDIPWSPLFLLAIFIFHPMLGWVALTGGGILIAFTLLNQFLTRKKVQRAQMTSQQAHAFANQAQISREIIQSQGMRAAVSDRWLRRQYEALNDRVSSADWTGGFTAVTKAFRLFLQSAMLAVGAYYVLRGELTAGAMIAASILLGRALAPIEQMLGQWGNFQRARNSWNSLNVILSQTPKAIAVTPLPRPDARLSVKSVIVVPPGAKAATLKNIQLEINPGEALGIIGRSGSGKSSIAKTILGLWTPASGEVRLGGAKLDQYDPDQLGRYIGYLPQNVTLLGGTIAENIARMEINADGVAIVAAAKRANAHEMILTLPNGYDTVLEGNQSRLSGGQRQRVALARALYGDPVLLILDEPNSALDADGSEALNQTIRDFKAEGKAVIVMTHRPTAIAECDSLVVLDHGLIVSSGPRDEVLKSQIKNAVDIRRKFYQPAAS
ncbi:MAG: type I secretion system permease/ATPase [Paracoccaceae bacterium]